MKLVELLALELSEWPEDAHVAVQDPDRDNTIWFQSEGHDRLSLKDDRWTCRSMFDILVSKPSCRASDCKTAIVTRAQWQAERDRQKGGEWKRHRGGKQPVANDTQVECRMRNGYIEKFNASGFMWDHNGQDDDIMAYRVISQPQAEEVEVKDTTIGTLRLKVEVDTSDATQTIDDLAAKWDQIETPFKWRDEVTELNAYIEKYTRERDALIDRLASEGFALIPPVVSVVSEFSGVDFSDWRNWKVGDIVSIKDDVDVDDGEYSVLEIDHSEYKGYRPIRTDDGWPDIGRAKIDFIRRP